MRVAVLRDFAWQRDVVVADMAPFQSCNFAAPEARMDAKKNNVSKGIAEFLRSAIHTDELLVIENAFAFLDLSRSLDPRERRVLDVRATSRCRPVKERFRSLLEMNGR